MTASAKAAQIHQLPATAPVQQFPFCLHRALVKHVTNIRGGDPDDDQERPRHSIDDPLNEALRQAGEHLPPDAREVFPDILADVISRSEGLHRVNQERAALGLAPWNEAVLRNALSRYRRRVRDALTALISEEEDWDRV